MSCHDSQNSLVTATRAAEPGETTVYVVQEAAWWWQAKHVRRHLEWHFLKFDAQFARNTRVPLP